MRRFLKFVGIYLALTAAVLIPAIVFELPGMLFSGFPQLPQSAKEWAIAIGAILLVLPVSLLLESLGGWLHDNRVTRYVENKTRGKELSGARILYNLAFAGVVIGIIIGLNVLWGAMGT